MANRRVSGSGSVYQRPDKRWVAAVPYPDGRKKYGYATTKTAAVRKHTALLAARDAGLAAMSDRRLVSDFSVEFLESLNKTVRPGTLRSYISLMNTHILPAIGDVPLTRLAPAHITRMHSLIMNRGRSPQTAVHAHRLTSQMLGRAQAWGYMHSNPASLVRPPRVPRYDMKILTPEQVQLLLRTANGERLESLWYVLIGTAMRLGESLALTWGNVDLKAREVRVEATLDRTHGGWKLAEPKTERSRRVIGLSKEIVSRLRVHRSRQNTERLRIGGAWNDGDATDFVFTTEIGTPLHGGNVLRRDYRKLLGRAGLSTDLTIHALRHTGITLALAQGVAPADVSALAGHANISTTLDQYGHFLPGAPRRAADAIADALAAVV
jgi:integrase